MAVFWIVLIAMVILGLVIEIVKKRRGNIDVVEKGKEKMRIYWLKEQVMNTSERALFINLVQTLGQTHLVFSKIRVEDFVEVRNSQLSKSEHWGKRGKIKSRHVDFLVCDKNTSRPVLAIELDGSSHNNYQRQVRDNFLDSVYREAGLRVEHVRVGSDFAAAAERIRASLVYVPTNAVNE